MVTRHELLASIHRLLRPQCYLETGVQYGHSLGLAVYSKVAIGIDPRPLCQSTGVQQIFPVTADDFFLYYMAPETTIDMAFIDGSHLFEDALRDFMNVEQHSHRKTVVVFDDVLPMTEEMASRKMVPGHWTGDVWKVSSILETYRPDLIRILVDTEPTGTMIVLGLRTNNTALLSAYNIVEATHRDITLVPDTVITRSEAVAPETALQMLATWLTTE